MSAGAGSIPKGFVENTAAKRADMLQAARRHRARRGDGPVGRPRPAGRSGQGRRAPDTPINVFLLSDGQITWGDADVASLVARFERRCKYPVRFHCYRTGLGADNLELFEALTRRGGGIFQCYGEADLAAAALAHRHQCLQVERVRLDGGPAGQRPAGRAVGKRRRLSRRRAGRRRPRRSSPARRTIVLEGTFQGEKFAEEYPVEVSPPASWRRAAGPRSPSPRCSPSTIRSSTAWSPPTASSSASAARWPRSWCWKTRTTTSV